MKTPKEFMSNLKNNIITEEMLELALRSVNKRAKNYRDKERQYRNSKYDVYESEEKNRDKKNEMYGKKEILLRVLSPTCIHKKIITREVTEKFYDYEEEFQNYLETDKVVRKGCFFDREELREIEFIIVNMGEQIVNEEYYVYYQTTNFSFHSPIEFAEIESYYKDLPIVELDFNTFGEDINDLVSMQFVNKLIEIINEDEYEYKTI